MYDKVLGRVRESSNEGGSGTDNYNSLANKPSINGVTLRGAMTDADIENRAADAQTGKMGYKIIVPTRSFAEQVTAENTIYEIRDVFDLGGTQETPVSVTLPAGSKIKFDGGVIKNCTIIGNNTSIDASNTQIFDNVTFSGTFVDSLNSIWVGAKVNDSTADNSPIIQKWFDSYYACFRELYFPLGKYYFKSTAHAIADRRQLTLNGCNSYFYCNIPDDNENNGQYFIKLSNSSSGSSCEEFEFKNIIFFNTRNTGNYNISKTRCLYLDRAQRFKINKVQFWYFDEAVTLKDVWYGSFNDNCVLRNNRIGIRAIPGSFYETNTISLLNVDFSGISVNAAKALYPQNDGESDDAYNMRIASVGIDCYTLMQGVSFIGCTFESTDYGIRLSHYKRSSRAIVHGGPLNIESCYFEDNRIQDIYVGTGNRDNVGNGSNYNYLNHIVSISCCRFNSGKTYFLGATVFLQKNQACSCTLATNSYQTTRLTYDNNVNLTNNGSAIISKIGQLTSTIKTYNGEDAIPNTSFQQLYASRDKNQIGISPDGYSLTSTNTGSLIITNDANFNTAPYSDIALDILPLRYYYDIRNSYGRLQFLSGNSIALGYADAAYQRVALNNKGSITLHEFIRRWKAGTNYTGTVKNLFPNTIIIANPTEGTVYRQSDNSLIGFGINAIGTTVTNSSPNAAYLVFVDALIATRTSYSRIKYYADLLQCGRYYSELKRGSNESYDYTSYIKIYGSNENLQYNQKRLNAVYYDTTNNKLLIFNGYDWVEMTSPFQRYYYVEQGAKLSSRMAMADYVGQTYHNMATGITYTFSFANGIGRSPVWIGGIGLINSLEHPNGYNYDNTLDYATELEVNDIVKYNGSLLKWDGTQFVNLDGTSLITTSSNP